MCLIFFSITDLPFIDDFIVMLGQREELSDSIRKGDDNFLLLTRQQYYNHPFIDKGILYKLINERIADTF